MISYLTATCDVLGQGILSDENLVELLLLLLLLLMMIMVLTREKTYRAFYIFRLFSHA